MSRKRREQRDRKRRENVGADLLGEDIEEHKIAFPVGAEEAHLVIRQRFWSHKWWTIIGFQSEERVRNIFREITDCTEVHEQFTWPVGRIGKLTGQQTDNLLLMFVEKTSIPYPALERIFVKHGSTSSKPMTNKAGERDFFPISFGYNVTLTRVFDFMVRQGQHADN